MKFKNALLLIFCIIGILVIFLRLNKTSDVTDVYDERKNLRTAINKNRLQADLHQRLNDHSIKPEDKSNTVTTKPLSYNDLVDDQLRDSLIKYNQDRKSRVIMSGQSDVLAPEFKNKQMLHRIQSYFKLALKEKSFNSANEDIRMLMIDYLGDVILGNITFEDQDKALDIVFNLLTKDTSHFGMDNRQKKSMIGDKMELMSYYTQYNEDQAYTYLLSEKGSKYFSHLKTAFINGLYFKGITKSELKDKMAEIERI